MPDDSRFSVDVNALPASATPVNPEALVQHTSPTGETAKAKARTQVPLKDGVPMAAGVTQGQGASTLDPASSPRASGSALASATTRRSSSPFSSNASPNLAARNSSPRHISPATSQIFERDVQESTVGGDLGPAIPHHIQTEDHIPPVLEASSLAITENIDPDRVEIVMSSAHQPASVNVTGTGLSDSQSFAHASHTELAAPSEMEESGSTYGAVDPTDPRRLSFISFADVVNAEHIETGKDGSHLSSFGSSPPSVMGNRSPSPIRSPMTADRKPLTPPMETLSVNRAETSPARGGAAASISSGHGIGHGELTIETMRQTLQKTGSNDIGGTSSQPLSATSAEDGQAPRSFR